MIDLIGHRLDRLARLDGLDRLDRLDGFIGILYAPPRSHFTTTRSHNKQIRISEMGGGMADVIESKRTEGRARGMRWMGETEPRRSDWPNPA